MKLRPRHLLGLGAAAVAAVVARDLTQREHAIIRNYPLVGHLRYWLETIGPELRQYIVTDNDQERPFNRDHRRWIYASAKREDNYFGFGTDNEIDAAPNYLIVKQKAFGDLATVTAFDPDDGLPGAKVLGAAHGRRHAFRPNSVVNTSAMSFGSMSGPAIEAINRGAALAGCWQNTGEGGISTHHLHGGDLVFQIGTGYFGCRAPDGTFSLSTLVDAIAPAPVRAIEVKLSQGAKAGLGGLVPGAKVSAEIAAIRGIPEGEDCLSPPYHSAFSDVDGLIDFVERLADATGLPVGIKSAVGESQFWTDLAGRMATRGEGPDFVTVDGGEGGTGAAPLVFADHVSLPFKVGFPRVFRAFAEAGLAQDTVFIGSGKLGLPQASLLAMGLGCDLIGVAREAMLAIGCIQAQRCHTDRCPTGVTTQDPWLTGGLDPELKSQRLASYLRTLRSDLLKLAKVCGQPHPGLVELSELELLDARFGGESAAHVFGYAAGWAQPSAADREQIVHIMHRGC